MFSIDTKKRVLGKAIFFFFIIVSFLPTVAVADIDDPFASITVKILNRNGMPIAGAIVEVKSWAEQKGTDPYISERGTFRLKTNSSGVIYIDDWKLTGYGSDKKAKISKFFPKIIVSVKALVPGMGEKEVTDYLTYNNPNCITTIYLVPYSSSYSSSGSSSGLSKEMPVDFAIKVADDYGNPISGSNIQISLKGYNGGVWMGHENFGLNLNEMSSESEWTWGEIEPSTNLYYGGSSPRNINVVSVPFNVTFWVRIPLSAGQEISIKATKSGYKSAVRTLRLTTNMIMEIDTKEIGLYYEVNLRRNKTQNRSSDNQKNNSGYGSDKKAKKKFVKIGESHPTIIRPDMGSFVDKRDGKVYKTVKIGSQVWMAENLNVDKFRNGDAIPHAKTNEEWEKAGKNGEPAWCYYDNDPANGEKYGKLYNWYVVKDQRGLAPEGWHTPSDKEWTTLTDYLGGKDAAGKKMKSTSGWEDDGNGTNESGFSGLPGGYRGYDGTVVENIGSYGYWWSTTASTSTRAWIRCLNSYYLGVSRGPVAQNKRFGFSVRLVRD